MQRRCALYPDEGQRVSKLVVTQHDHQRGPHPYYSCRQSAAQPGHSRASSLPRGAVAIDIRNWIARWIAPYATWSKNRSMPASISTPMANTAACRLPGLCSSTVSPVFRRIQKAAWPRLRGVSRTRRRPDAAFPGAQPDAECSRSAERIPLSDTSAIARGIERLKNAAKAVPGYTECFLTAPSPGIISTTMFNAYYDSHESYLAALAREMSKEYRAIHDAGFILQIDSPDLAMDRSMFYPRPLRRGVCVGRGEARRGAQPRHRRDSTRTRPPALLLGELGGTASARRRPRDHSACSLPGQRRRPQH